MTRWRGIGIRAVPGRFLEIGVRPEDPNELRLRKQVLVRISSFVAVAAVVWGLIYLAFDEPVAASIPLSYSVASAASLLWFSRTESFAFYRISQLLLILLLPFLLMVALGGFVNSSGVVLWSLLAPLGALLIHGRRQASWWFIAFTALVVLGGLLGPIYREGNNLSTTTIVTFFVLNIGTVSTVAFGIINFFLGQLEVAYRLLGEEQEKSESLLLNVLPPSIAARLKGGEEPIADRYEDVSVLFADIVGFTPMSQDMDPEAMVESLNQVFSHFDSLVARHGVEKIRTIGDNYMVAAGVPAPRDDHAIALGHMALEMMDYVGDRTLGNGNRFSFRIGINSGPAVAGVIGDTKFQYDIWGDTVNTASRMESHGVSGKIQISEATYEMVREEFDCRRRGAIDIKGKGEMTTWFLEGVRDSPTAISQGDTAAGPGTEL